MRNNKAIRRLFCMYLLVQTLSSFVHIKSLAQTALLETSVSLQCTNYSLLEVMEELRYTYNIPFSYFKNQLPSQKRISLSIHHKPLYTLLNQVSLLTGIHYQAIGGQIVLKQIPAYQALEHSLSAYNPITRPPFSPMVFKPVAENTYPITQSLPGSPPIPKASLYAKTDKRTDTPQVFSPSASLYTFSAYTDQAKHARSLQKISIVEPLPTVINLSSPVLLPEAASINVAARLPDPQLPEVKPAYIHASYQIALLPGISTHGIHPGKYINALSLNLLAGYSAGNKLVEIGGLSNFNQQGVNGLQIGGVANVVGGNKLTSLSQKDKQKQAKDIEETHLQGVQLAGIINIINGHVYGWQTAGAVNVVKHSLQGIQVAGLSNLVHTYSFGFQLAGLSNASMESLDGVQIAALYNYTAGELHGIQVGGFNQAGKIEGKRSLVSSGHTGLQLGLVNTAGRMNGFQFGLINIGGNMAGTQIGLINFHTNKKGNGVPIGLLNITSTGQFVRLYTSEILLTHLEISTGSQHVQNMLSFGYNPIQIRAGQPLWSVGYSIGQVKRPGGQFFYSYDAGLAHLNITGKFSSQLSLLTRARASAGYKVQLGKIHFHVFGGLTLNSFLAGGDRLPVSPGYLRIYQKTSSRSHLEFWPGFVAGIHL